MTDVLIGKVRKLIDEQEAVFGKISEGIDSIPFEESVQPLERHLSGFLVAWGAAFGEYVGGEMARAMLYGYFLRGKVDSEMVGEGSCDSHASRTTPTAEKTCKSVCPEGCPGWQWVIKGGSMYRCIVHDVFFVETDEVPLEPANPTVS